jgi:hypothetical protein
LLQCIKACNFYTGLFRECTRRRHSAKALAVSARITKLGKLKQVLHKEVWQGHWWLWTIILTTQEAETRRIRVWSQPQANSMWDPILKKLITWKGWWIDLSSKSASLASVMPWVQTPVLPKNKQMKRNFWYIIFSSVCLQCLKMKNLNVSRYFAIKNIKDLV